MITLAPGLRMYDADKTHTILINSIEDHEVFYSRSDSQNYYSMKDTDLMRDYYPITPLYVVQIIYMREKEIIAGEVVDNYNVYIAINKTDETLGTVRVPTLNLGKSFLKQKKDKLIHDWMPLCNTKNYLDQDGAMDIPGILGGKVLEAVQKTERIYGYLDTNIMNAMYITIHHIEEWLHNNDGIGNSWAEFKYPYKEKNKVLETIISAGFEDQIDRISELVSLKRLNIDKVKDAFDNFRDTIQSSTEIAEALIELLRNIIEKTIYKNSEVDINSADIIKYNDNIILDELEKKVQNEGSILIKVKLGYKLENNDDIYLIKFRLIPKEPPMNKDELATFMAIKK